MIHCKARAWYRVLILLVGSSFPLASGPGRLAFERLSLEHGLSQTLVSAIHQDQEGFLWIGTMEGLNRFDGYTFTWFKNDAQDPRTLSHDSVTAIVEDAAGRLWVGTDGGLNRFDPASGAFTRFSSDPGRAGTISSDSVLCLHTEQSGELWVGTAAGIDRFDAAGQRFHRYALAHGRKGGMASPVQVRSIQPSPADASVFWLATDQGLVRFCKRDGTYVQYGSKSGKSETLINDNVFCAYESPAEPGIVWVGTIAGLDRLDVAGGRFSHWQHQPDKSGSISSNRIRAIYEDRQGSLWIGTDGGGLNRLDRRTGTFTWFVNDPRDPGSLSQNSVLAIFEDRAGFLWLGTSGGGLNRVNFQKSMFVLYKNEPANPDSLQMNDVLSICESRAEPGTLWVGNQDGGLNRIDRRTGRVRHYLHVSGKESSLSHNSVYAIHENASGMLWLGTMRGLNRFDARKEKFVSYMHDPLRPDSLPDDFVLTLFEDHRGRLWAGTRTGGLAILNEKKDAFSIFRSIRDDPQTLSDNAILSIIASRQDPDLVWIGTANGLNRMDTRTGGVQRIFLEIPGASKRDINYILVIAESLSDPGLLWLGTLKGLVAYDSRQGRVTRFQNGLPGNLVYGIIACLDGFSSKSAGKAAGREEFLWLSTSKGLSRFQVRTGMFKNFGWQEGIAISDFNRGAVLQSPSGEVFFGGTLGMYSFFPTAIKPNPNIPPVVITSIKVNEREVAPLRSLLKKKEMVLKHNQNFISFEFTALDFTIPEKNRFAYRMEGLDPDWVYRDANRRFASYTDVKPGKYVFKVKASNNDGLWNEEGASLRVIIQPPFWLTWWFFVLAGCTASLVVYGVHLMRVRGLKKRQIELEQLVSRRTRELKKTNADLEHANRELERLSLTDSLTQLPNRRNFELIFDQEWKRCSRESQPLSVLMVDIDFFKLYNDTYGHPKGDECLKQIALSIYRCTSRAGDFVARLGGEEFVIVLSNTHAPGALLMAERVRASVEELKIPHGKSSISPVVTISVGVATAVPERDKGNDLLIAATDRALYQAKISGRNRIHQIGL